MSVVIAWAVVLAAPVPADPLLAQVAKARARAVDYLLKAADKNGVWPSRVLVDTGLLREGTSALAVAALLEAGALPTDPPVAAALARFADGKPALTYPTALATVALAKADPKKHKAAIRRNVDWLTATAVRDANKDLLGWSYPFGQGAQADGSNTQYAVLALAAAADAGVAVEATFWAEVRGLYVRAKRPGGWTYTGNGAAPPTQPMTAAAVVGLLLADKHGKADPAAAATVKDGLAAWSKGYPAAPVDWEKPGPGSKSAFYTWHGTARLGRLAGKLARPKGDDIDWFRDGATWLVKNQRDDGSWQPTTAVEQVDSDPLIATGLALLFLGPPKK